MTHDHPQPRQEDTKPQGTSGPVPPATQYDSAGGGTAPGRVKLLMLATLGVGAFAVTFVLVRLGRTEQSPSNTPPGMVWIRGGEFTMGTDSDLGWADEKPAHRVRVDGFFID